MLLIGMQFINISWQGSRNNQFKQQLENKTLSDKEIRGYSNYHWMINNVTFNICDINEALNPKTYCDMILLFVLPCYKQNSN